MKLDKDWTLVYTFSKKLSVSDTQFERYLSVFKKSVQYNKKYHKLKLYTDKETYPHIYDFGLEVELIDFEDFLFLDDLKIKVIPFLESNEVMIDPDIFLLSELKVPKECDIVMDRPASIYGDSIQNLIKLSKSYKFGKLLDFNPKNNITGNIGILKIFNKNLEKSYIDFYDKVKEIAKEEKHKLPPFPSFSILVGELGLKNIIDKNDYKVVFLDMMNDNKYKHLAGSKKYDIEHYLKPIQRTLI